MRQSSNKVRAFVMLLAIAVVAGVTGLAYANTQTIHKAAHKPRLAVFTHPLRRARAAATIAHVPASAVLAADAGKHELYVWEGSLSGAASPKNLCVENISAAGLAGSGCGSPATVTDHGLIVVSQSDALGVSVTALLPNGVSQMTVTDRNGSSTNLTVSNNVAETDDANISSLSFTLANGKTVTEGIPAAATAPGATITG